MFPFLAMIFSDHEISDLAWARAGTTIELSDHTNLSNWLLSRGVEGLRNNYPIQTTTSEYGDGAPFTVRYHYTFDDGTEASDLTAPPTKLTLPTCDTYIRGCLDLSGACSYLSSSLPELSGEFGQLPSSTYTRGKGPFWKKERKWLGPNDGTKGNTDWTMGFDASRSSPIYGRYARLGVSTLNDQVIPPTTRMNIYSYVGR